MTSERLFNSFIHPQKLLDPPKQISDYAPGTEQYYAYTMQYSDKKTILKTKLTWTKDIKKMCTI